MEKNTSSKLSESYLKELDKQRFRKNELRKALLNTFDFTKDIVLEIGCGHGHWLSSYSIKNPNKLCLGIDIISKRIEKANAKKHKHGISNLYFLKAEINELMEVMPLKAKFETIIFLFPDPWPKARHHKKRMIQKILLDKLAKHTNESSLLFFRSDDINYFEWTKAHIHKSKFWEISPNTEWIHEDFTYFQNMMESYYSLAAGRTTRYIMSNITIKTS